MIGLVYAGGKSTRFGKDKATYHVPGLPATNIELAVEKLTPFCQQIVVCANEINRAHILKLVGQEPTVQIICDISLMIIMVPFQQLLLVLVNFPLFKTI